MNPLSLKELISLARTANFPSLQKHSLASTSSGDADTAPIHILVLENNATDVERTMARLALAGLSTKWKRVDSRADFVANLTSHWHIILSDYYLTDFDALQALELLREHDLDTPFIILSGGVDDEVLVHALRQGAADFIFKDCMARLPTAIEQAFERKRLLLFHQQAQKALQVIEQHYGMLAKVSPVGILHFDAEGLCLDANERWAAMAGTDPIKAIGQGWTNTLFPADRDIVLAKWALAIRDKISFKHEYRFLHSTGAVTWVVNDVIPEVAIDGSINGYVGITTDITKHKLTEFAFIESEKQKQLVHEQLEQKNIKLAALNDTAQRFVDDVSHEFRTPLSVIKGYAEIIHAGIAGPVSKEQVQFTQLIIDRTQDMTQMVDDLLDTSKLRAGSLRVDRRSVHVSDIFAAVRPSIQGRAAAAHIQWVEEMEPNLPLVFADAEKAARVLVNLALNACKFSPEGSKILLSAKTVGKHQVRISVTDHGQGISPENLAAIFERFRQVGENSATKGFGLGLNIAKKLSALNLGELSVESELHKGSIFSFTLPVYDPIIILARLFEYLETMQTPPGVFALVRIIPDRNGPITEQLRSFLACSAHPGDLILPTHDGQSLVIFGYSVKPQKWLERLSTAGKSIQLYSANQKLRGFQAELAAEMPYPCPVGEAYSLLSEHLSGAYTYA